MNIKIITISSEDDQSRIDRWLKTKYRIPFSVTQKYLRIGKIKVNNRKVEGSYRLTPNDQVRVCDLEIDVDIRTKQVNQSDNLVQQIAKSIIYEDDNLLIVNKPSGVAVQNGNKITVSIDSILPSLRPDISLRLVHRIDRYTSGLLIIAKKKIVAQELLSIFRDHKIKKTYLSLLDGVPQKKSGIINAALDKGEKNHMEKMIIDDQGKEAITNYRIIDFDEYHKKSIALFSPKTGRKHQIRVHASAILGCPIFGDSKYGSKAKTIMHLHAWQAKFKIFGQEYSFIADIPHHFLKTMAKFNLNLEIKS